MSKRLYIVVEGQTEEEFVKDLLAPFFLESGIYVYPVVIHTSKGHKGGFVNYAHLRNDVLRLLKSQGWDVVVSTFVDFFRCPDVPGCEKPGMRSDHSAHVSEMESAMKKDIDDYRFYPYIQLHEFEALLFSSEKGFKTYFDTDTVSKLRKIMEIYDNPEEINSTPEGAPSKRLLRIVPDYDKVIYGNILALETGLQSIMDKCSRFRGWVNSLLAVCK